MTTYRNKFIIPVLSLLLTGALFSCGEDRWEEYREQVELDTWMYDLMAEHYLWYSALPSYDDVNPFLAPSEFLSEVKASNDRYSFVDSVMDVPLPTYGFDYSLVRSQVVDTAYNALVTYVIPGSPADEAGIKRGDWIMKVDTFYISRKYEAELLQGTRSRTLVMGKWGEAILQDSEDETVADTLYMVIASGDTLNMAAARSVEDVPLHAASVIELNSGEKVGYLMYNSFTAGTADSPEKYNEQLREWSAQLSGENINKVILDLRYNGGGTMDCVQLLSTILAPSYYLDQPMTVLEYNDKNTQRNTTLTFDTQVLGTGENLDLNTLIVLTSNETSGAPEMLINNLNGKIQRLIAIGSSTAGQNVATERFVNETHRWAVNPVVCTVYNAEHVTYESGFQATYSVNATSDYATFLPFGDPNEALLSVAIGVLEGTYPPQEEPEEGEEPAVNSLPQLKIEKSVQSPAARRFTRGLQLN